MFNINVYSRGSIENVKTSKSFGIISIIEPVIDSEIGHESALLNKTFSIMPSCKPNCFSSLCLRFYDVDVVTVFKDVVMNPISNDQAKLIANFMRTCEEDIEELYVNCAAGISRSAAVVAAISKFYTGNDDKFYKAYVPNRYVYMRVLEALYELT